MCAYRADSLLVKFEQEGETKYISEADFVLERGAPVLFPASHLKRPTSPIFLTTHL